MRRAAALLVIAGITTFAVGLQRVNQLQHNGKTVSTNLKTVDGVLMVSAKDVAAYLGGDLSVENGTATVRTTGKTDPMAVPGSTYSGIAQPPLDAPKPPEPKEFVIRPGESAANEGFRFSVVSVSDVEKGSYRTVYDGRETRYTPRLKDDRLVVVRMRIENGSGGTARPPVPNAFGTTLFDSSGVGVPVLAFDARPVLASDVMNDSDVYRPLEAPMLTAEGSFEFAALFSLPKGNALKRLTVLLPSTGDGGGTKIMVDLVKSVAPSP